MELPELEGDDDEYEDEYEDDPELELELEPELEPELELEPLPEDEDELLIYLDKLS